MHRPLNIRRHDTTIEQAAFFTAVHGHIAVLIVFDRKTGKHGVTVVAFRVDSITPVGVIAPHSISKKFVVGGIRPVLHMQRMNLMRAHHFLQANNIGADGAHRVAKFRQNETPVKGSKAFMGIYGEYFQ